MNHLHNLRATLAAGLIVITVTASAQNPSNNKYLLPPGAHEWTYEVTVHGYDGVSFDPYVVNESAAGLVGTSITHGSRRNQSDDAKTLTLTIRTTGEAGPNGEQRIELDDAARNTFFGPSVTKTSTRFVVLKSDGKLPENHPLNSKGQDKDGEWQPLLPFPQPMVTLEIQGTMDGMKGDDPWILREMLAIVPADGRTPVEHLKWQAALEADAVVVPAGTFKRVFHSTRPRGGGQYTEQHTFESWVAEGVGLIKVVAMSAENKPLYTVQLKSYK